MADTRNELNVRIGKANVAASALRNLILFTLAMFSLPFGAYYATYSLTLDYYDFSLPGANVTAAVAAVVAVNIIIAIFVYIAWKEAVNDDITGAEELPPKDAPAKKSD